MQNSLERDLPSEHLALNQAPMDPHFGPMLQGMRRLVAPGGSEFGLGVSLFSLAVSIRAERIVEIGRYKGFSTVCLAYALRFLEDGWQEPMHAKQRPDMNYASFEASKRRCLISVDLHPTPEAAEALKEGNLEGYVQFLNQSSADADIGNQIDLLFIDGDHSYEGCRRDVRRFVPHCLRPGGYFILHDYFGWYDKDGRNRSPVKRVIDELVAENRYQHLLIDTGYMSFVVFRTPNPVTDIPS
jgi:predicted O-methyltransferase YrrM